MKCTAVAMQPVGLNAGIHLLAIAEQEAVSANRRARD